MLFDEAYRRFWMDLGESRTRALSTSLHDLVTSRMMSIVVLEGRLFFQTDRTFRKYEQIKGNAHVALCADNFQIEGECKEVGRPVENPDFCRAYEKYFHSSFQRYSGLENERLFAVTPTFIERWAMWMGFLIWKCLRWRKGIIYGRNIMGSEGRGRSGLWPSLRG